ncbi:MAG TPA: hypothetical protein VMD09_10115 [Solirubrobacteraceae bacterium]|nr:hypothetical protein [Solirubrobacteraceae bacterium]
MEQAAKLRADGGTWNQIREATGTKLGSTQFFRAWEREGIAHAPAGSKPKPTAANPDPATKRAKATSKPNATPSKGKRTVRTSEATASA